MPSSPLEYLRGLGESAQGTMRAFLSHDAARRMGVATGPGAAVEDRRREGALIAKLLGPAAPVATVPVALAGAGYEGAKALGISGPGPFEQDATTSPPSIENVIALLRGYTGAE